MEIAWTVGALGLESRDDGTEDKCYRENSRDLLHRMCHIVSAYLEAKQQAREV